MNIPLVADLPVGEGLQDHVTIPLIYTTNVTLPVSLINDDEYKKYKEGKWSLMGNPGPAAVGFIPTIHSRPFQGNDTQLELFLVSGVDSVPPQIRSRSFLMLIFPTDIRSRGFLKLRSKNVSEPPLIDPKYLSDIIDDSNLKLGISKTLQLLSTSPFKRYSIQLYDYLTKYCGSFDPKSPHYIDCMIRHGSSSGFHYSSTCRMGHPQDPKSVVDPSLRVLGGVTGLRVVDASVFPQVTRGNTNAPTIMVGEKGADLIKRDWIRFPINLKP
jgi:choline dehydrogenase-like flavoprotein